jgi:hypothetical protein
MATRKQPAKKNEQPATKPASDDTTASTGVGIKELAEKLQRDPKSVRASIRRLNGGPVVGQGGRYHWESEEDPAFVAILEKLTPKPQETAEATA